MKKPAVEKKGMFRSAIQYLSYKMIDMVHDNERLMSTKKPIELLKAAGLQKGQKVLEVGCGPGFFTFPAAGLVGPEGLVYAVDSNPYAIRRVEQKMEQSGAANVRPMLANAGQSGIAEGTVDLAFVFGLLHVDGGIRALLDGLYKVIRVGGTLAFEKTRKPDQEIIDTAKAAGFCYTGRQDRVLQFAKR